MRHVTQCLVGKFGKDDALLAIDLLFFDISDKNPDRRSCAMRVLQQALGKQNCYSGKKIFDVDWKEFLGYIACYISRMHVYLFSEQFLTYRVY